MTFEHEVLDIHVQEAKLGNSIARILSFAEKVKEMKKNSRCCH